jgi:hypothetical protein
VLRHTLGVINVVEGAAAVLRGTIALEFRETALIPELHGEAGDGTALLQEKSSHHRTWRRRRGRAVARRPWAGK